MKTWKNQKEMGGKRKGKKKRFQNRAKRRQIRIIAIQHFLQYSYIHFTYVATTMNPVEIPNKCGFERGHYFKRGA